MDDIFMTIFYYAFLVLALVSLVFLFYYKFNNKSKKSRWMEVASLGSLTVAFIFDGRISSIEGILPFGIIFVLFIYKLFAMIPNNEKTSKKA